MRDISFSFPDAACPSHQRAWCVHVHGLLFTPSGIQNPFHYLFFSHHQGVNCCSSPFSRPVRRYRTGPGCARVTECHKHQVSFLDTECSTMFPDLVDAAEKTTVSVKASAYDTDTASDNGCDPSGCTASKTRDGDLDGNARWACKYDLKNKKCRSGQ